MSDAEDLPPREFLNSRYIPCMAQVGGDIVPEDSTFQGWPAEMLSQPQPKTEAKAESSDLCIDICADAQKPSTVE